ncbi:MAG: AAA family ATPase [Acidobacteria bacterium]|nr:AAA family ATPase [Acidobacteriota bacterium]
MIVTRLKVANVRAIEAAEFAFKPGFNLIVGVNGVGKTTALEALAVSLAAVSRHVNRLTGPVHGFAGSDIRVGSEALTVESEVRLADRPYAYVIHQPRETAVAQAGKEGMPREQTVETPAKSTFVGDKPPVADGEALLRPLVVLFSTRRALPSERAATKSAARGGHTAAFAEAFSPRELRLGEFAAWMRAQTTLAKERAGSGLVLEAFEKAVRRFIPGYTNLRVSDDETPRLLIDRRGVELPVRQLSDGERGSLALVLDLTRRLAQANPGLEDPAANGPGVVLIDEIDLHLHPKWQREIVRNLPEAFPGLQFIATTHSPQVIGETEHDRIHIMGHGAVFSPTHSFGVDSSRVLEEIMDAAPRSSEVQAILDHLSKLVADKRLAEAASLVAELSAKLGESDAEVIRAQTLLDFLGGEE